MKTHMINKRLDRSSSNMQLSVVEARSGSGVRPGSLRGAKLALVLLTLVVFAMSTVSASGAATSTRPIEDFVSTQGTFCLDDGMGGCFLFVPPVPNYIAWTDTTENIAMSVDYAGLANSWIVSNGGDSLGTTTSGTVVERPLRDGRAQVQVLLHTTNALAWVIEGIDFTNPGPLLFGHRATDVLGGADPSLGGSFFELVFINTAPGSALPDLEQLVFAPNPGQELISISFRARADGTLRAAFGVPEATPGRAETTQTGLLFRGPFKGATADGFPAEHVSLRVAGR